MTEKDEVDAGQGLLVVEAMKMQNEMETDKKAWFRRSWWPRAAT